MTELKWPKSLIIIRHGESEQNAVLDLFEKDLDKNLLMHQKEIRDADIELTDKGINQAQKTGELLAKEEPFDICLASPYKRTIQTAENILSKFDYEIKLHTDNRLREKEFGRLHAFSEAEIKEKYPEEFEDRKREGKYWYRLPRGENYPDVEMRVHSFLGKLNRDYPGKRVLIITHQVPYKIFRTLFGHLKEEEVISLPETPNCGIQEFKINTKDSSEGKLVLNFYDKIAY
jgi:broad specificity phosphatase PhoE